MRRLAFCLLLVACSSGEDETALDASFDQTIDSTTDVANDVVTKDATADVADATTDVTDDAADVSIDVIAVDAGGGCSDNNACLKAEYCEKGTGNCSGTGACAARPQICNQLVNPVCGCDKKTYTNSCYAHMAGTSVMYTGGCE